LFSTAVPLSLRIQSKEFWIAKHPFRICLSENDSHFCTMMLQRLLKKIDELLLFPKYYKAHIQDIYMALGRIEAKLHEKDQIKNLREAEFKVFSRAGEEGIIQYLISRVPIKNKVFIEFGVQSYLESNTRFLLQKDNWTGLVIDGDNQNIEFLKKDSVSLFHNITGVCEFITAENINQIFSKHNFSGEIGILSIDIDGVDYFVWKSIEVINPQIVIAEYNSLFGPTASITVPYSPDFYRTNAHHSNLFFGASLNALNLLANQKGYSFVGCDSSGSNAFFVRIDCMSGLSKISVEEGYVKCQFRQSRDRSGSLTYLSFEDSIKAIGDLKVLDLDSNQMVSLKDVVKI